MIVASIDIGTNTVLLLIAEVNSEGNIADIKNEYRIPRIGKGLLPGHPIAQSKIKELINSLSEYESIIKLYNCEKVLVTATNAFRIASNCREIVQIIFEQFGWKVNVVSGTEEALLSYLGAATNIKATNDILVIDIGGGSTELVFGNGNAIKYRKSFNTGVVSAEEYFLTSDPPTAKSLQQFGKHLDEIFAELPSLNYTPKLAIALAGTPTTLACMKLNLKIYNEKRIERCILKYGDIHKILLKIEKLTNQQIKLRYKAVVKGRQDLILAGSIILLKIMNLIKITEITVSTKGIRYGAIIKEFRPIT